MDDAYRIQLMPLAAQSYSNLRERTFEADPFSPVISDLAARFTRVNSIIRSLMDPGDIHLDQPLLEGLEWVLTRSIETTHVYFFRIRPERQVGILHITEYDGTSSYARFWNFMTTGGCALLSDMGVNPPSGYRPSPFRIQ
jgi:hypothetical protein